MHLSRLITVQTSLQHALSHALATCASSPSQETGIVRNVLTHLSLETYTGLTAKISLDDLRRLCWIWEWDGRASEEYTKRPSGIDDDDNPFLDTPTMPEDAEWVRGAMGIVISPTTHYFKSERKRVPAYGIGIEVEMDIDKDMKGGMAAVARWTAAADRRRTDIHKKLDNWAIVGTASLFCTSATHSAFKRHKGESEIPNIPLARLPPLPTGIKMSSLTRTLVSGSPKAPSVPFSLPCPPSSPSKTRSNSLTKHPVKDTTSSPVVSLPATLAINSIKFPQTPSKRNAAKTPLTPHTPSSSASNLERSRPSTPVQQRGNDAFTAPKTPTTARQLAIYERVRQRSLSASPTKVRTLPGDSRGVMSQDHLLKLGQEEIRQRCLLGRLSGVAESIWM